MLPITRMRIPVDGQPQDLVAFLPKEVELVLQPSQRIRQSFLDSFDWRLWRDGVRLWLEELADGLTLHLAVDGDAPVQQTVRRRPRLVHHLPSGFMRDRVAPALGCRALLPLGQLHLERHTMSLRDGAGNTCARLLLERLQPIGAEGLSADDELTVLTIQDMPGHRQLCQRLRRDLAEKGGIVDSTADPLLVACSANGREPGDYSSKPRLALAPKQPVGVAAQLILRSLLHTMQWNVQGVIEDLDSEFLHDLRVAVRRSRSLLSELKSVLDRSSLEPYREDMKWLGTITGPLRDLDVFLLEMEHYRQMLPVQVQDHLGGLHKAIRRARGRARRRVVRGLRGTRFATFNARWGDALEHSWPSLEHPPRASVAVSRIAGERILKAYRRVVKHGSRLGGDPGARDLHSLRIDAKKLRYLLELFRSLYPEPEVDARIKELKRLQDILGGFNDMEVQQTRMTELARELAADGGARTEELLAIGRLQAVLGVRQEGFRREFHAAFQQFFTAGSEDAYRTMCGLGRDS